MTLPGSEEARRQRKQLDHYLKWVQEDDGIEGPGHLDTYLRFEQLRRMEWLKSNSSGQILEAGCSWGFVLAYIGGHAGVDINPNNVALARILAPGRKFYSGDIRELSTLFSDRSLFPDKPSDTVLLTEVLEHIPFKDISTVMEETRKVCREKILITVPLDDYMSSPKHQWWASPEKQIELIEIVQPWTYSNDGQFLYLKVRM